MRFTLRTTGVTARFSLDLILIVFMCVKLCLCVINCLCVYFGLGLVDFGVEGYYNHFRLRRDQWNPQRKKHMFSLSYELNNPNHIYLTSVIETTTIWSLYFYKFHSWYPSIIFIPNYDLNILYTDMKVNIIITHLQCFFNPCSRNNP